MAWNWSTVMGVLNLPLIGKGDWMGSFGQVIYIRNSFVEIAEANWASKSCVLCDNKAVFLDRKNIGLLKN